MSHGHGGRLARHIPLYCNSSCCLVTHHSRLLSQLSGLFWFTGPLAVTLPLLGCGNFCVLSSTTLEKQILAAGLQHIFRSHAIIVSATAIVCCQAVLPKENCLGDHPYRGPDRKWGTRFLSVSTITKEILSLPPQIAQQRGCKPGKGPFSETLYISFLS